MITMIGEAGYLLRYDCFTEARAHLEIERGTHRNAAAKRPSLDTSIPATRPAETDEGNENV